MNRPNINHLQDELDQKYSKKDKKKRPQMKVSGTKVKNLQRIIKEK